MKAQFGIFFLFWPKCLKILATLCICPWTMRHTSVYSFCRFCTSWSFIVSHARENSVKTQIFFYLTIFSSALLCLTFTSLCIFTHIPNPPACKHACIAITLIQSFKESLKTGRVKANQPQIHYPASYHSQFFEKCCNFQLRLSGWSQSLKPVWDLIFLTSKFLRQPWQGTISWSWRLASGIGKIGISKTFKLLY